VTQLLPWHNNSTTRSTTLAMSFSTLTQQTL
jgi:hypothetical protein